MRVEQRYRYVYKPLVWAACLIPFAWALGGVLAGEGVLRLPVPELGADPVRAVLDIFGKTALNLLLITLTVTPLRLLSHNAHLIRLRRLLGLFAFFYALLHFVIYVWPFSGLNFATIGQDLVKRPYITIGFLALLLLVPLAVTSTVRMMRRLGRRWQSLHRLIYLIALLGVWHYWWQVKKDFSDPLLYALILGTLLIIRIGRWDSRRATSRSAPPKAPGKSAAAAPSPDS